MNDQTTYTPRDKKEEGTKGTLKNQGKLKTPWQEQKQKVEKTTKPTKHYIENKRLYNTNSIKTEADLAVLLMQVQTL